jgi:hypothetical protein
MDEDAITTRGDVDIEIRDADGVTRMHLERHRRLGVAWSTADYPVYLRLASTIASVQIN